MSKSIEFEELTKDIYQDLLRQEGLTTEVKHNVKIKGKSTTHQIDVFWEYEIAGVSHKVAIECKNYNKKISKGIITSFHGVLTDIGNINGILVTKIGFQKGAKEFADHYGINLIELREPKAEDWNGRLRSIETNVQAIHINVTKWFVLLDYEWCKNNLPVEQLKGIQISFKKLGDQIWLYSNDGKKIKNFQQLQNELPHDENKLLNNQHIYKFEDAFIESENTGHVKIVEVQLTYDTSISSSTWLYDSMELTKAILKNAKTGEIMFIKDKLH